MFLHVGHVIPRNSRTKIQRWRKWEMTRVIYDNCLHVCDKKFLHTYYHQGYKVHDYVDNLSTITIISKLV